MPVLPLNAVIGKYRIEELVGAGGMGEVYKATNLQTRTPVAVKALTLSREPDSALARFRNEAVIQYNLHHPNVAELYEYFTFQGNPCIVMEFVEGRTLDDWVRESGRLEVSKALEIIADICDAVSYMHSRGTIHRDIKSENIRINAQSKAKLLDFGIAVGKNTPALTKVGYSIGTPAKMAPEQHLGLRGDARSDVWALGVLLYEMVTGVPPFANSSDTGLRQDILAVRYVPPQDRYPGVPRPVVRLISNCLRLKPEERYASGGVMLREVQQLRRRLDRRFSDRARDLNPAIVAGALAVLVLGLLLYAVIGSTPQVKPVEKPIQNAIEFPKPPPSDVHVTPPAEEPNPARPTPLKEPLFVNPPVRHDSRATSVTPETPRGPQATVRVATYDGPADVINKDGQKIGSTPYPLTGPVGTSYELWLRREGFQSRQINVEINVNKKEYLFGLEKN